MTGWKRAFGLDDLVLKYRALDRAMRQNGVSNLPPIPEAPDDDEPPGGEASSDDGACAATASRAVARSRAGAAAPSTHARGRAGCAAAAAHDVGGSRTAPRTRTRGGAAAAVGMRARSRVDS